MARKGRLWENPVKPITVGEKVPLELNQRERDLIVEHTFADNDLCDRLRIVPSPGRRPFYRFTLDELDELAGYVAAEANHAKVKKLEKESCTGCTFESRRPLNPIQTSLTRRHADNRAKPTVESPPIQLNLTGQG